MKAHHVVEETARDAYGRLISYLAVNWRDQEDVEDALADAFLAALETWPHAGVPDKPESWLLTVARRKLIDRARRHRVSEEALPTLLVLSQEAQQMASTNRSFPDERLKMLFLCTDPAIDQTIRTPLMLQTVLGIDAARIASAFVVKPSTMGQRLTRAKAKMRDARLAFTMPEAEELPHRLEAILEAIYAAYGSGWDDMTGSLRRKGLVDDAIYLGKLLSQYMPSDAEVHGLLALMLHCEARREARLDEKGNYIPLSDQDTTRWSIPLIMEAEHCLRVAAQAGKMGRFQLLAAIQSVHAQRAMTGRIEWKEIALLYEGLTRLSPPTIGVLVGRAAAVTEAYGAERGLKLLEAIPQDKVVSYQPYWALAAHLNKQLGRNKEAKEDYSRAIGLSEDPSVRQFLSYQAKQL
jgi:predicted RNA polymerase sigma factor